MLLILCALPVVLPMAALVAAYLKVVSPGPLFFKQKRIGFKCRPFELLKFRSMHAGAASGTHEKHLQQIIKNGRPMNKIDRGDSRLIPLGRWFRASGLDELPQLWNVLRGEMSLVGPRPCTSYEFDLYEPAQRERFNALPGLTGWWQVNGKNRTTFREMIQMDIDYTRRQSLWLDVKILFRTIPTVIHQLAEARKAFEAASGGGALTISNIKETITTSVGVGYEQQQQIERGGHRLRLLGT